MLPFLPLLLLSLLTPTTLSFSLTSNSVLFCKCICFGNSTIVPLYLPKNPLNPCLTCTQQFCLDQKFPSCLGAKLAGGDLDTSTGKEGDVESRCFQRDSPKSHFLVLLFIVVTGTLLIGAGLKQYGVDLPGAWSKGGFRGVILELTHAVKGINKRNDSTTSIYTAMPT